MQREEHGGVIISCDFCGTDWDPYDQTNARPMTEGHHGSVICLECVKQALAQPERSDAEDDTADAFTCTLCLGEQPPGTPCWRYDRDETKPGQNPQAAICRSCLTQAAGVFSKDPDVPYRRDRRAE